MPTVREQTIKYCEKNNLPAPLPDDLSRIGSSISFYFRHSWGPDQTKEIISEARFVTSHERNCKPFIIIDYPEAFKVEMNKIISHFYYEKNIKKEDIKEEVKPQKRARKIVGKTPVFSAKKS